MSLNTALTALVNNIGGDIKALRQANGDLSTLSTTAKNNLVAAINDVYTLAQTSTALINDAAALTVTDKTWSVKQISDQILSAKNTLRTELTNGASAALDTFGEIAAQLAADESSAAALATSIANRVRYDAAQTLTLAQQTQALSNIGGASATKLQALTDAVGDTTVDLVALYTTAKA